MKSFILSNYDLKSQSKLTPLSNACNYRYATSRLTLTSTASSNRWNDLITLKCIVQEVSKLSTLLLIDKKLNNLQRVRYWKEDTKWFCKKSFNMSLNYFMWSPQGERVRMCYVHCMQCYVMPAHSAATAAATTPWSHDSRAGYELTYLSGLGNLMQLSYSNKCVMIEVCPLYLLVKNCEPQIKMLTLLKSQDWNRGRGESAGTFARRYTANEWKKD